MENPPIFKKGKPSISMAHLYHGKLLNNQRVYHIISYLLGGLDVNIP
jgi:hypothetical protein